MVIRSLHLYLKQPIPSSGVVASIGAMLAIVALGCDSKNGETPTAQPSPKTAQQGENTPQNSASISTTGSETASGTANSRRSVPRSPVGWVIEGGAAQEVENASSVHDFEMPTDTSEELNYEQIPYVFVSEKAQRVVLRRGMAIYGFFDPTIGEHCYPAHYCINPDCSAANSADGPPLVGVNVRDAGTTFCPACGLDAIESAQGKKRRVLVPYYSPQHKTLEAIMFQQRYRKRPK